MNIVVVSKFLLLFPVFFVLQTPGDKQNRNIPDTQKFSVHQYASNAKNPGRYSQIVNASKTVLEIGDSFEISYLISGYGSIDVSSAKAMYTFSADIVDSRNSSVIGGFKDVDGRLGWGGMEFPSQDGVIIYLGALAKDRNENYITLFDDFNANDIHAKTDNIGTNLKLPIIRMENKLGPSDISKPIMPPYLWKVKLKESIEPGDYYCTFLLTYFNGSSWQNDRVEIKFRVMTWYEEYADSLQFLAVIIAALTLITLLKEIWHTITKLIPSEKLTPENNEIASQNPLKDNKEKNDNTRTSTKGKTDSNSKKRRQKRKRK